ncbi:unnamed protein product [Cuscuta epithymum]|uniref:Uncharacterized protein n=1 Tax=Cuscuta epithymum TaxID=186058 RepID=A0AAV0GK28_9ASTE|nr:unnamed protein product [Cuscuta epithymum]CAH9147934.1 unnamed protein product [Cuscuta epithymum]
MGSTRVNHNVPSLVDLCIQFAICTIDELACIEKSTEGRDLSSVIDKLWKKFYEQEFGEENTKQVVERMKHKKITFKWKHSCMSSSCSHTKLKVEEEAEQKSLERIKYLYEKQEALRKTRSWYGENLARGQGYVRRVGRHGGRRGS